jgi:hypothetical protein
LETIAEQLDSALEGARLYQDTQRRAAREQAIRHVTEEMRRAVDVESILQNTVTELARAMGAPRAYVRLGTESELVPQQADTSQDQDPLPPTPDDRNAGREPEESKTDTLLSETMGSQS